MIGLLILMQLQNIDTFFKSIEQSPYGGGGGISLKSSCSKQFTEEQVKNYHNFKLLHCKNRFTKYAQLCILLFI